jgi:hypothetical protein
VLLLVLNTKSLVSRLLLLANRSPNSIKLLSPHRPNVFDAQPPAPLGAPVGCCVLLDGPKSRSIARLMLAALVARHCENAPLILGTSRNRHVPADRGGASRSGTPRSRAARL